MTEQQDTTIQQPDPEKNSNLKFFFEQQLLGIVPCRKRDLVEIGANTHTIRVVDNANGASSSTLRFPIQTTVNMINEPIFFAKCDIVSTFRFDAVPDSAAVGDGTDAGSLYNGLAKAGADQNKWMWSGIGGLCSYFRDMMSPLSYNDILINESMQVNTPSIQGYPMSLKKSMKHFLSEEDFEKYPYLRTMEEDLYTSYKCVPDGHPYPFQRMLIPYGYGIGETSNDKNNKFDRRNRGVTVESINFYQNAVLPANLLRKVLINGATVPSSILASAPDTSATAPLFDGDLYLQVALDCGWQPLLHPLLRLKNDSSPDVISNTHTLIYNATVENLDTYIRTTFPALGLSTSYKFPKADGTASTYAHPASTIQSLTTTASNWRIAVFQREVSSLITKSPISTLPMLIADAPWVRASVSIGGGVESEVVFTTQQVSQIPEDILLTSTDTITSVRNPDKGFLITGVQVSFSKGNSNIFSYDFDRSMLYNMSRKNGLRREYLLDNCHVKTPYHYNDATGISTGSMINQGLIAVASGLGAFGNPSKPTLADMHPSRDVFILNFVNDICSMALGATASTFCDALCTIRIKYKNVLPSTVTCDCEIFPFYRRNLIINSATNVTVLENKLFLPNDVLQGISILNSRQITHVNHPQIGGFSLGSVFNSVKSFLSPKIEGAMKFAEKMAPHVKNAHDYVKKQDYFGNEHLRSFGKALNSVGLNEHLN